jgi:hypothetical protein
MYHLNVYLTLKDFVIQWNEYFKKLPVCENNARIVVFYYFAIVYICIDKGILMPASKFTAVTMQFVCINWFLYYITEICYHLLRNHKISRNICVTYHVLLKYWKVYPRENTRVLNKLDFTCNCFPCCNCTCFYGVFFKLIKSRDTWLRSFRFQL